MVHQAAADHNPCSESSPNLPFELLSYIFEILAEQQRRKNSDNYVQHDPHTPPFQIVVSHVCRYWRTVALSTPSLWTAIFFPRLAWPPPELVALLVERSKPLPIDVHINPQKYGMDDDPLKFPYHSLLPHIHRWRSLTVDFQSKEHELSFLMALSHPSVSAASQLTILVLHREDSRPTTWRRFTLFNGSAPRLTSITLWGVYVDWHQPWISSASNLTTLELGYLINYNRRSWAQLSATLRSAPALKKLVLCSTGTVGEIPTDPNNPIPLLNLTEFVLAFESVDCAIGFLRMFCMSALKRLSLDLGWVDYTDFVIELAGPATSLSRLSTEEQPHSLLRNLEELTIYHLPCNSHAQKMLYDELRNVKSLRIPLTHPSPLPCDFARLLLPVRRAEESVVDVLVPCLDTLVILKNLGGEIGHDDYIALRDVVQQRKDAKFPLKSLSFDMSIEMDDDLVNWYREAVGEFNPYFSTRHDHDPCRSLSRQQ